MSQVQQNDPNFRGSGYKRSTVNVSGSQVNYNNYDNYQKLRQDANPYQYNVFSLID